MTARRPHFEPGAVFDVRRRRLLAGGQWFSRGDRFLKSLVSPRTLRQLYEQGAIAYPKARSRRDRLTMSSGAAGDAFTERRDVEIPDGWRDLPWPQRRALAALLTEAPVRSAADAEAAITAELERRLGG